MGRPLILVESEEKEQTLKDQFEGEGDILVVSSALVQVSYVPPRDKLKREKMRFDFAPLSAAKAVLERLIGAEDVYLAFDCDNRGEYWAWTISEWMRKVTNGTRAPRRLHLSGMTRDALRESFRLVEPVHDEVASAFHVRSVFNNCLTRHLHRLLGTTTGPGNLPLNYYSLTALFLMADRDEEIKAYSPSLKWQIRVRLAAGGSSFGARLEEAYEVTDDGFFQNASQGREVISLFKDAPFIVDRVERSGFVIQPPAPYRLAELLHDAKVLHGLSPRTVAAAAQRLFSGVLVEGSRTGLISTPLPLADADLAGAVGTIRTEVSRLEGDGARSSGDGENNDLDGVILPLRPELSPEKLASALGADELKIYALIRARAMASQMRPARGENIAVEFRAGEKCRFLARGRRATEPGFLAVYQGPHDSGLAELSPLAEVREGQTVSVEQIIPEQTSGFSPERYGFESLAADLADFSIPLDFPIIAMLQSMVDGGYLAFEPDGTLCCLENVAKVVATMNRAFPSMNGINLPAFFEQTVAEVVSGRKSLTLAFQQFDQTLMMRGQVLVKATVAPVRPRPRLRRSSRVIKGGEPLARPVPGTAAGPPPAPPSGTGETDAVPAAPAVAPEKAMPQDRQLRPAPEISPEPTPDQQVIEGLEAEEETAPLAGAGEVPAEAESVESEIPDSGADGSPAETEAGPDDQVRADVPVLEEDMEAVQADAVADETGPAARAGEIFEESAPLEEASRPAGPPPAGPEPVAEVLGDTRPCPSCGRPLLLKEDRFGKYWFCSGHPDCRYAESYDGAERAGIACPLCRVGKVIAKKTPAGRTFYVCPEADCEFMAWSAPHPVPCQSCSFPFLVEKKSASGRIYLRCPRAGCNYKQPLPGDTAAVLEDAPRKKVRVRRVRRGSAGAGGKKRLVRVVRKKK